MKTGNKFGQRVLSVLLPFCMASIFIARACTALAAEGSVRTSADFAYQADADDCLYKLDESIVSNDGCTPFTQSGTLEAFGHFCSNDSGSITLRTENCSVHTQSLLLNQPAIAYDPEAVTVLKVRYKVGLDDYAVAHPNARLVLSNYSISAAGGSFSPNTKYTPNTGDLAFSAGTADTWRTAEFLIDPAAKMIYVSNDGGAREAYPFLTELTGEIMQGFRLYVSVRTADMEYYESEQGNQIIPLSTAVNWTLDSVEMYRMAPEDFLKVSNITAEQQGGTVTYSATFQNHGTAAVEPALGIVALYNDGRLAGVRATDLSAVMDGQVCTVSGSCAAEDGAAYTVKAFVWRSMGSLIPYDMQEVTAAEES